eukprot:CAMPEP_0119573216 /NCGR_PEP_ID=MMETSP1352-20130426/45013_1 /TAXON_ID=265584 /ORGANISM="Stauroneis constricta, Strain CCMP1120" /LENGTH=427 /DNA_ID=CAMNT_0007622903 /DNA_START=166 /DNA_END=1449 /DNA_ORIENTATION=+
MMTKKQKVSNAAATSSSNRSSGSTNRRGQQQQGTGTHVTQAEDMLLLANSIIIALNDSDGNSNNSGNDAMTLIQQALRIRDLELVESILYKCCNTIQAWLSSFMQSSEANARNKTTGTAEAAAVVAAQRKESRPLRVCHAQARHRLAQTSLLLGKLDYACTLLLSLVAAGDNNGAFSDSALLAMWYDLALIYLHAGKWNQCEAAIARATAVVRKKTPAPATHSVYMPTAPVLVGSATIKNATHGHHVQAGSSLVTQMRVGSDETMLFFLHQILMRLKESVAGSTRTTAPTAPRHSNLPILPWSLQFTTVTQRLGVSTNAVAISLARVFHPENNHNNHNEASSSASSAADGNHHHEGNAAAGGGAAPRIIISSSVTAMNIPGILLNNTSCTANNNGGASEGEERARANKRKRPADGISSGHRSSAGAA